MFRMSIKMICLVSFVLVLGLFMSGSAVAGDPSLVLWLEFEGNADDSSGYDNHGTLMGDVGNAQIVTDSLRGQVLETDGNSGFVDCGNSATLAVSTMAQNISVMCWLKSIDGGFTENWGAFVSKNGQNGGWQLRKRGANNYATFTLRGTSGTVDPDGTTNIADDEWHHLAGTYDGVTSCLYVDGDVDYILDKTGNIFSAPNDGVAVGARWNGGAEKHERGRFDDVRIYSRALTAEEIQQVMISRPSGLGLASGPSPADEATYVPRDVVLNWTPGEFAAPTNGHKVYFGESFDDVNDATGGDAQTAAGYAPAQRLDFGTTYYWRVDEVNAPPTSHIEFKGEVWNFTTEPIGYPIASENITAIASSSNSADEGPENTVNGSGLDDDDLHSAENVDMWRSSAADPNAAWIQYEFDRVHILYQMWVWNYNSYVEPVVGFGVKEATIEYSVDGTNWAILGTTHEFAQGPGVAGYAPNTTIDLSGVAAKYVKITANSNWGGIVNQYGLSEVRFLYIPILAREPSPDSGATDVDVDVTLSWKAGREAAEHNVYISTDEQAVIDSNVPVSIVTEAQDGPLSLGLGETYYWKVNEVNDAETPTMWEGDIWNFTTPDSFVVEDFEDYNDYPGNRVYETWADGWEIPTNGAMLGYPEPLNYAAGEHILETTNVHSGKQSLPFFYDNSTAASSEATVNIADIPIGSDWAGNGVKSLSLWFSGDVNNVPEQMYVKLNGVKVSYDGDASNLSKSAWQPWNINLADFAGVDLSNVTELGIGLERIGFSSGSGMVLFDDIRLYPYERQLITPVEPGTANLVANYAFEGNLQDSSGNGLHGTALGSPTFAAGKLGQAISLDGIDDFVEITGYKGILQSPWTLSCWIKTTTAGDMDILSWGTEGAGLKVEFRLNDGRLRIEHGNGNIRGDAQVHDGMWHHAVAVLPEGGVMEDIIFYLDGELLGVFQIANGTNPFITTEGIDFNIGRSGPLGARYFTGMIDDVYIYDRALSQEEIAWLAGRTQPFDKTF